MALKPLSVIRLSEREQEILEWMRNQIWQRSESSQGNYYYMTVSFHEASDKDFLHKNIRNAKIEGDMATLLAYLGDANVIYRTKKPVEGGPTAKDQFAEYMVCLKDEELENLGIEFNKDEYRYTEPPALKRLRDPAWPMPYVMDNLKDALEWYARRQSQDNEQMSIRIMAEALFPRNMQNKNRPAVADVLRKAFAKAGFPETGPFSTHYTIVKWQPAVMNEKAALFIQTNELDALLSSYKNITELACKIAGERGNSPGR